MNGLGQRLMVAMAMLGLMAGAPLVAQNETDPVQEAAGSGNYLDALAIATANVRAAIENAQSKDTKLPPEIAKALSAKLGAVGSEIDKSGKAFRNVYKSSHPDIADPGKDIPPTLDKELEQAANELQSGGVLIEHLGPVGNAKRSLQPVKDALNAATRELLEARRLVPLAVTTPPVATVSNPGKRSVSQEQIEAAATKKEQEIARQSEMRRQIALSAVAIVLSGIAMIIIFLPVGPVKNLRSSNHALDSELKLLVSKPSDLKREFESLKQEIEHLKIAVKKVSDAAKNAPLQPAQKTWTGEERRKGEPKKEPWPSEYGAGGTGAQAVGKESPQASPKADPVARAREDFDAVDKPAAAGPVKTAQRYREPVADYNEVRTMKAADRATQFGQLYPKQMMMTCTNPSLRNSAPFSDLRLKEDQYGKFQAVEHGKETLLFPELNYDYTTGRKTLEGVFQYPEVEANTLKLIQAATLEKRGDEWALTRQGVFQNG